MTLNKIFLAAVLMMVLSASMVIAVPEVTLKPASGEDDVYNVYLESTRIGTFEGTQLEMGGQLLLNGVFKSTYEKDDKKETVEIRIKTIEKQEEKMREKTSELQKEVMEKMGN